MFEIHVINGISCPVLVCDMCGEHITDASEAVVVFKDTSGQSAKLKALHVHTGSPNGKTCHQEAESLIRSGGGTPAWQDLRSSMADLAHNSGFPAAEMYAFVESRRHRFTI